MSPPNKSESKQPKYAPAREDGLKPYLVTVTSWGTGGMTVWTVWQEGSGLVRIYATEQEANAYAEAIRHPEGETSVVPYPVIGAKDE